VEGCSKPERMACGATSPLSVRLKTKKSLDPPILHSQYREIKGIEVFSPCKCRPGRNGDKSCRDTNFVYCDPPYGLELLLIRDLPADDHLKNRQLGNLLLGHRHEVPTQHHQVGQLPLLNGPQDVFIEGKTRRPGGRHL